MFEIVINNTTSSSSTPQNTTQQNVNDLKLVRYYTKTLSLLKMCKFNFDEFVDGVFCFQCQCN